MTSHAGSRIQTRFRACVAIAVACMLGAAIAAGTIASGHESADALREHVLELNEARATIDAMAAGSNTSDGESSASIAREADASLSAAQAAIRDAAQQRNDSALAAIMLMAIVALAAVGGVAAYLYRSVVAPFLRLEAFATDVANGDLDAPLAYERSNPFGQFAWAFDHLRTQLVRAHAAEAASLAAHKTALASLSHDLRTPLAALRAHAEALELGLARTPEEQAEYERLIMRKCDEAAGLVEDLLTHALADMERIDVTCEPTPIAPVLRNCVAGFSSVTATSCARIDDALLTVDPKRLAQAIDNLLANAAKYAPDARVEVSSACADGTCTIAVRDFGPGVCPEDLPFLKDRFYRGANAADNAGAGLGLFIAEHLACRMGGTLSIENAEPGLRVTMAFPLA